jgi:hypothetical protein
MRRAFVLFLLAIFTAASANAATIVIVNNDAAGEGFNDPTPVAPVGGNSGTTLGQQRLNVFQYAADIWGSILPSNVTIRVASTFDPLTCDASSAVLGAAGPTQVYENFPNAEWTNTWYHVALANKKANYDQDTGTDDIQAQFNSSVDNNNGCLSGTNWYYGFDGNEGSDVELLTVVLHELAHGLGFSTFVNSSNGALFYGDPDIYCRFLYDETQHSLWPAMNNAQRAASAINTGNLDWDGFAANFAAPSFLNHLVVVQITAPPAIAGTLTEIGLAGFGPQISDGNSVTGEVVLVDDGTGTTTDGCEALVNAASVAGKIALIDRGTCTFTSKVQNAENAGAIGVLIVNNTTGVITMGGTDPGLTIPALMITSSAGSDIKTQLGLGQTVMASMTTDPNALAGTYPTSGRVLMYAPNPLEPGSSVSHWDISASPNLLMEPAINPDLHDNVDLTRYVFEDEGWFASRTTASPDIPLARNELLGNAPNPFNPATSIRFNLARRDKVSLKIYDNAGRLVRDLFEGYLDEGPQSVRWGGRDDGGKPVVSGVYHYRLQAGDFVADGRMVLLK